MLSEIEIVILSMLAVALAALFLLLGWGLGNAKRRPRRLDAERLAAGGALVAPHDDGSLS